MVEEVTHHDVFNSYYSDFSSGISQHYNRRMFYWTKAPLKHHKTVHRVYSCFKFVISLGFLPQLQDDPK